MLLKAINEDAGRVVSLSKGGFESVLTQFAAEIPQHTPYVVRR